jgi:hypothetical protein
MGRYQGVCGQILDKGFFLRRATIWEASHMDGKKGKCLEVMRQILKLSGFV